MAKYIIKRSLFSEEEDAVAAAALTSGGLLANDVAGKIVDGQRKSVRGESEKISRKLIKEAQDQGTSVYRTASAEGSYYLNPDAVKYLRKKGIKVPAGKSGDYIATDPRRADIVAHELGHSKHYAGRSGSVIGKVAHKINKPSKSVFMNPRSKWFPAGMAASYANGYDSGVRSAKAEKEGKKESAINKIRTPALSVGATSPVLISEFEASRQGLKAMKRAGASSKLLNDAKLRLAAAGGTYAAATGLNAGVGYFGRYQGKKSVKKGKKKK